MQEELVTFETAVLAKEKGFDWECSSFYESSEYLTNQFKKDNWNQFKLESAPTQSLLQRWLRDKFGVFVDCSHSRINDDDGVVTLYQTQITSILISETYHFKYHSVSRDCYGITYEQALEKGLYQALKLIENE